ncbi:MAG TPA: amidohydrolase family protein [Nocardioidaceae bacterium]|nr:amidohydrolase family protein [Nocardioidaceae bacterium]
MTRTLFRGGYVHTPADPHATALCIEDGQVVWTGDDDASAHFADNADRIVELEGRLVTPAFVDAHAHLAQTGLAASSLDLSETPTLGAALDALAAFAASSSFPIVLAYGWDETQWPEQRPFTREEVDRAVGARPAYLARVDVHSAVVSSALLDAAPELKDADGYDGSGSVAREAHHVAREAMFAIVPVSAREDAIRLALSDAAAQGIGMVHELGAPHLSPPEDFETIAKMRAAATLPEVVGYWGALDGIDLAAELGCVGAGGDLCVDGAIGSRTAAMHTPYVDADTSGHLYLTSEQVRDHVVACTNAGLQAAFHAIGDRATAALASGFKLAADALGTTALVRARHRVEHLEMVSPADMRILGQLGVTASVQPVFDELWGGPDSLYAQRLGADRAEPMNPYASLNRAGVALAFGSDTPVTPFGPWAAVRAAAHHHNEGERLTVRAAFNAHTRGGWRAARRDEGGVIALGAPASIAVWDVPGDLVVQTPDARVAAWSTDPRAGVPHLPDLHPDLDLPGCVMTVVAGKVAYEEPGALG